MISIDYDAFSAEVSWKLFQIIDGVKELIQSYDATENLQAFLDSICLPVGLYEFIIFDSAHDGICCKFDEVGSYSLSLEDVLIKEGGEFESSEITIFSIPFISRQ